MTILKYEPVRLKAVWQKYHSNYINYRDFKRDFDIKFEDKTNNAEYLRLLLAQHDELIIRAWNSVVGKHDTVWFLGDFCMGGRSSIAGYVSRLNGIIRMVKGNHDNYPNKVYLDAGVKSISEHPVLLKQKYILSHAPIEAFVAQKGRGQFFNIFGHVHSSSQFKTKTKNYQCVSIERQCLMPIQINEFDTYQVPRFFDNSKRHENI